MNLSALGILILATLLIYGCDENRPTIEYVYDSQRINAKIKEEQILSRYNSEKIKRLGFSISENSQYVISLFENGLKEMEGPVVNGKKEGLWKYYYSNGAPKGHLTYKQGEINGGVFEIDSLGGVRFVGTQIMGELDGWATYFFADGSIRKQGQFKNGQEVGPWIRNE